MPTRRARRFLTVLFVFGVLSLGTWLGVQRPPRGQIKAVLADLGAPVAVDLPVVEAGAPELRMGCMAFSLQPGDVVAESEVVWKPSGSGVALIKTEQALLLASYYPDQEGSTLRHTAARYVTSFEEASAAYRVVLDAASGRLRGLSVERVQEAAERVASLIANEVCDVAVVDDRRMVVQRYCHPAEVEHIVDGRTTDILIWTGPTAASVVRLTVIGSPEVADHVASTLRVVPGCNESVELIEGTLPRVSHEQ